MRWHFAAQGTMHPVRQDPVGDIGVPEGYRSRRPIRQERRLNKRRTRTARTGKQKPRRVQGIERVQEPTRLHENEEPRNQRGGAVHSVWYQVWRTDRLCQVSLHLKKHPRLRKRQNRIIHSLSHRFAWGKSKKVTIVFGVLIDIVNCVEGHKK